MSTGTIFIFIVAVVVFQQLLNLGKRWKLYGAGFLVLCGLGVLFIATPELELAIHGKNVEATVISDTFDHFGRVSKS